MAGEKAVVSMSDSAVRVDPCDACGTPGELLALARSRVTRTLSAQERATYLGTSVPRAVPEPEAGLVTSGGEPVKDGLIESGRYRSIGFAPGIAFDLDDDWFFSTGSTLGDGETRVASVIQLQPIDDQALGVSLIALDPGRVVDGRKDWDESNVVAPFPRDLGRWLSSNPYLDTQIDDPVTVDGVRGSSATTRVISTPDDPWPTCGGCVTLLALTLQHDTGPLATHDLINALGPGEIDRWAVFETDAGTLLVNVYAADREAFARFLPDVDAILRSMRIRDVTPRTAERAVRHLALPLLLGLRSRAEVSS